MRASLLRPADEESAIFDDGAHKTPPAAPASSPSARVASDAHEASREEGIMANLSRRREGAEPTTQLGRVDPFRSVREMIMDPFRAMRQMMNFDPFAELEGMIPLGELAFVPRIEVKETSDGF